jgi:hypothetical protein
VVCAALTTASVHPWLVLRSLTYSSLVQPAGGKANIYGNAVLGATLGCAAAVAHILVKSAGECGW